MCRSHSGQGPEVGAGPRGGRPPTRLAFAGSVISLPHALRAGARLAVEPWGQDEGMLAPLRRWALGGPAGGKHNYSTEGGELRL